MPKAKKEPSSKEEKMELGRQYLRTYAMYSGIAFEMLVLIGGGAWFGFYLDDKYGTKPLWIMVCSLAGVAASLFILFKGLLRMKKN